MFGELPLLLLFFFLSVACYQFETPPHKSLSLVNCSIISSLMKQLTVPSVDKSLILSSLHLFLPFAEGLQTVNIWNTNNRKSKFIEAT